MTTHFKSHNLKNLANQLTGLMEDHLPEDPLQHQQIIVPNLDTSRWLKMFLAEQSGIAANLEFILPSEWQWNQVRKLYPDLPKTLPSDHEPMKWGIYEVLLESSLREKFPFLNRYITSMGEEYKQQRCLDLAGQMAWLFDQYQVYRPDMVMSWQNGRSGSGDEEWQSALWRLLDKRIKNRVDDDSKFNRAELFLNVSDSVLRGEIKFEQPLIVFNPGLIPKTIAQLFKEAGNQTDVYLFFIQPSKNTKERQNELLRSFGSESRRISVLFEDKDAETLYAYPLHTGSSDLNYIQNSIIKNEPITPKEKSEKPLEGIQVRSCHSPVREIETLHQFLIEQFEKEKSLHPDDILVVTPNLDQYRPAIHAVFGSKEKGLPQIPYHCDLQNTGEYDLNRAFLNVLSLIDSRFTYSRIVDFIAMKSVREKFGLSEPDTDRVRRWMKDNHVIWGLSPEHRADWGQPAETLQTWSEALKRGWLGQWIDVGEDRLLNNTLLFNEVNSTSEKEVWASFSKFLNALEEIRKQSKVSRTCKGWCDFAMRWMENLFVDDALVSREGIELKKILDSMKESCTLVKFEGAIGFAELSSVLRTALEKKSTGSSSANFNRGVVFSSMVPVRSIPAKIIALIGLNEETFPRKPSAPEFDLMAQKPALHDRNRKEEDRNLFLESMLAAKNIHYCSYVGQSPVDNETIPPSPILGDWIDILAKYAGMKSDQIVKKEPLSGYSPTLFQTRRNYSRTYYNTAKSISGGTGKVSGLRTTGPLTQPEEDDSIYINQFVRFFGNPVQWFLKNRFDARLYEPETDKEEFELDSLEKHILFQRVFGWVQRKLSQQQMEKMLMQSGALPTGWAGQKELREMIQNVHVGINKLDHHSLEPAIIQKDLSFQIGDIRFEGDLITYSKTHFLEISPSSMSGKLALQTWIRHLLLSVFDGANGESYLLCEMKEGKPKLFRFKAVSNAEKLLEPFVKLYKMGISEPQQFFPKTVYTFVEEQIKGSSKAMNKARKEFEGGYKTYGERENKYISILMGEDANFHDEFVGEPYRVLMQIMTENMEEVK